LGDISPTQFACYLKSVSSNLRTHAKVMGDPNEYFQVRPRIFVPFKPPVNSLARQQQLGGETVCGHLSRIASQTVLDSRI
jgi:hypothetical protein